MKLLSTWSLLACILLAAYWAIIELPPSRAGRIGDCFVIIFCEGSEGQGYLYPMEEVRPDDPVGNRYSNLSRYAPVKPHRFAFHSGSWAANQPGGRVRWWIVVIPIWSLVALTAILPIVSILRRRAQSQRHAQGKCHKCGYDIRATPDRCPECGTPQSPPPTLTSPTA